MAFPHQHQPTVTNGDNPQTPRHDDDDEKDVIYYFSYGIMVNPIARHNRGVQTEGAHAALLKDCRLNFTYGGAPNIDRNKTGWEVYGVVMKCSSVVDWERIADYESGLGFECIEVDVYSLKKSSENEEEEEDIPEEEEGFAQVHPTPIRARTFFLPEERNKSNTNNKIHIPQERSLRVIASGLQVYHINEDYINDEIMGVEFLPRREFQDYYRFPCAEKNPQKLTKMTETAWENHYYKRMIKAAKKKQSLVLFRLGEHALEVQDLDKYPDHPFGHFIQKRLQGPQDSTYLIVKTFFDPDMPLIDNERDVTVKHQQWAVDQLVEKFQGSGCFTAKTILRIHKEQGNRLGSQSLNVDAMRNLQLSIELEALQTKNKQAQKGTTTGESAPLSIASRSMSSTNLTSLQSLINANGGGPVRSPRRSKKKRFIQMLGLTAKS